MTRSRSHRSPEPSEHPGTGRTAISLCLGCKPRSSGSCIREGDISGKSDAVMEILRSSPGCKAVTEVKGG